MEGAHIVVEPYQQALNKVNVFCRYDYPECIGAEYENQHCDQCSTEHGFRIIDRRVLYVAHMYARHLHACIEEEYRCRQHNIVEVGEVGDEISVEIHL